jgi:hypothetical protein
VVIWYSITRFGMFYREKSGNPAPLINLLNSDDKVRTKF